MSELSNREREIVATAVRESGRLMLKCVSAAGAITTTLIAVSFALMDAPLLAAVIAPGIAFCVYSYRNAGEIISGVDDD